MSTMYIHSCTGKRCLNHTLRPHKTIYCTRAVSLYRLSALRPFRHHNVNGKPIWEVQILFRYQTVIPTYYSEMYNLSCPIFLLRLWNFWYNASSLVLSCLRNVKDIRCVCTFAVGGIPCVHTRWKSTPFMIRAWWDFVVASHTDFECLPCSSISRMRKIRDAPTEIATIPSASTTSGPSLSWWSDMYSVPSSYLLTRTAFECVSKVVLTKSRRCWVFVPIEIVFINWPEKK